MNRPGGKGNSQTAVDRIAVLVANPCLDHASVRNSAMSPKFRQGRGLAGSRVREA
jgi:hypothetical protein